MRKDRRPKTEAPRDRGNLPSSVFRLQPIFTPMIKKILKWTAIVIGVIVLGLFIFGWLKNEKVPSGSPSAEADALANKVLATIDYAAWDSTSYVQWSFPGGHDYLWNKDTDMVRVKWKNNEVKLHTKTVLGKAFQDGTEVQGETADELIQTAWGYFCNDSFWLNAPAKVFDPGTSRSLVTLKDGREGLMIRYESGGVTPGDSYVWILDENGLPTAWKMWVKIIPVGGTELSWENWTTLSTGAKISQTHKSAGPTLELTNVKAAMTWQELGETEKPF